VAAVALMSHLGWVTALYLAANHMMVKGILFLVAAAVIVRTGTRLLSELGGLAWRMPLTFAVAVVAIVSMSGLPPLAGFGGKWLLLSAMLERNWHGPAVLILLATFVGFLYMARFIQAIFLGPQRNASSAAAEAPMPLLTSQYLLMAGILFLSFFPKLLIEPISRAIDPYFSSTLVWEGMSLEMIYGYWNPIPTMAFAVAVSAALFVVAWLLHRSGWFTPGDGSGAKAPRADARVDFASFYRGLFAALTPPMALAFWNGVATGTLALADRTRRVYTGDGQTYCLYVVYYFIVVYAAGGGLRAVWPSG
jgi:NADH:ubiquinone oxidoreductase subunit 5 (subunit L)/multisubunit Na+/H+ antiporter MnhA subunit